MPPATDPLVELDDVTKRYGTVTALDDVSFAVAPGETRCLIGPNGAGKSTVFSLVAGLATPDGGEVTVRADRVGYGFQTPACYHGRTVSENLDVFAPAGVSSSARESLASDLGLSSVSDRLAGELSGGYRKRLDLALALVGDPALLVLDEPLAGLDEATARRLLSALVPRRGADRGTLVVTHHVDTVADFADTLTVLDGGRVVASGRADEFGEGDGVREAYLESVGTAGSWRTADR